MRIKLLLTGGTLAAFLAACAASEGPARNGKGVAASKVGDPADGTPKGMVSFFAGETCPTGWAVADVASGRLIAGVTNPTSVGKTVGAAMSDKTSPAHAAAYKVSTKISSKDLVAASGKDNKQGADDGTVSASGDTDTGDSRLPFVQLVVCQKQ